MKKNVLTICLTTIALLASSYLFGEGVNNQVNYNDYFTPERLRIDIVLAGNSKQQTAYLTSMHKEKSWSGSKTNLIDNFNFGEYMCYIYSGEKLIFSRGFKTLFQEWRTTAEAKKRDKAFPSSITIPCPKGDVTMVLYERKKENGKFEEFYRVTIDPNHKLVNMDKENDYRITPIFQSGDPSNKVDLLFIAEGYTTNEMKKFIADCNRFMGYLFDIEPYKSRKSDFNIWAVESPSQESGTDIPHKDIWKSTIIKSHFYTFEIDRYMTAPDQQTICSVASNASYDAIYVIVNTDKYGGGGIYNFYGLSMADHKTTPEVFVHEFGHSFAGLGDEYYSSEVAYEDFYNLKVEPWEPNLTTLVNFDAKWKSMIAKGTPIPTPNDKKYLNILGLFEGGGYMAKGIYRPYLDCRMITNKAEGFCPVCQKAISSMIDYYTK
jgi:hypothetical protein